MAVAVKVGRIPWCLLGFEPFLESRDLTFLKRRNTCGAPGIDAIEAFSVTTDKVFDIEPVSDRPGLPPC